ncbi:MAG: tRNA threonylcarbamoyladenosine dehydratase [Polaromonas sp.]|nr:tRNA threonylcarbamoyladenosine dehydratase [Polaromonas sp.]
MMVQAPAADTERRFGGLARLYGAAGAARIRSAHIVVIGVGGVGSWAAEAAARSGIGRLTLIDLDHISESNINRQIHALTDTVGMAKVQAMRQRIALINEGCRVDCIEAFVDAGNWPAILGPDVDLQAPGLAVIDACDQVRAKTAISAWAVRSGTRFISVGAAGGKQLAHKVDIEDLSLVTHDPLLAQMRYRLRREHAAVKGVKKIGIACVFSREAVVRPALEGASGHPQLSTVLADAGKVADSLAQTDATLNCHGYGSVVSVTATFGLCAAGWVLSKMAGPT